jgi:hypothetical protein
MAILVLGLLFRISTSLNPNRYKSFGLRVAKKDTQGNPAFSRIGEKITYGVRLGKIYLGKAVFHHVQRLQLQGQAANLITFDTHLVNFQDSEIIYSNPTNSLPIKIERRINHWPFHEKITENYDQSKFILTITKVKGRDRKQFIIRKNRPIHNAILLPFYVRLIPKPDIGLTLTAQLPTQQFVIRLVSIEKVRVPAGEFKCYHFESFPKKFEIWISQDPRRIPVKIKGLGAFSYILVMQDYSF